MAKLTFCDCFFLIEFTVRISEFLSDFPWIKIFKVNKYVSRKNLLIFFVLPDFNEARDLNKILPARHPCSKPNFFFYCMRTFTWRLTQPPLAVP